MTEAVKRHTIFFSATIVLAVGVSVLIRFGFRSASFSLAAPPAVVPVVPTIPEADLAPALIRAGLDAETLAALGVTGPEVAGIVAGFETAMAAAPDRLGSADSDYASARGTCDTLKRLIQSGRGSPEDVTAYQAGQSALQTAEAERASALHDFCTAGVDGLSGGQTQTLETILANSAWNAPIEFKTVQRTEEEWVALRKALANERILTGLGEEPDPTMQALLATARSDQAVALASSNLATYRDAVRSAWDAAVRE